MRGYFAGNSVRRPAGVLFALLACVVAAPSKLQAGCASHVVIGVEQDRFTHYLDPLILGLAGWSPVESDTPASPGLPRPCSGPTCSGNPSVPAVPSVSETRYTEPWACLGPIADFPSLDSGLVTTASSLLSPILAPDAIFHPPRGNAPGSIV